MEKKVLEKLRNFGHRHCSHLNFMNDFCFVKKRNDFVTACISNRMQRNMYIK